MAKELNKRVKFFVVYVRCERVYQSPSPRLIFSGSSIFQANPFDHQLKNLGKLDGILSLDD